MILNTVQKKATRDYSPLLYDIGWRVSCNRSVVVAVFMMYYYIILYATISSYWRPYVNKVERRGSRARDIVC